jgi:hypothetical protein
MQTPTGRVEVENVSKIHFSVYTVLPKVMDNDFEFSKIDFKTEFEKKYLNGQKQICFSKQVMPGDVL